MTDIEIGYGWWKRSSPFLGQKTMITNIHSQSSFPWMRICGFHAHIQSYSQKPIEIQHAKGREVMPQVGKKWVEARQTAFLITQKEEGKRTRSENEKSLEFLKEVRQTTISPVSKMSNLSFSLRYSLFLKLDYKYFV